jgi:hypothetical protein
MRRINCRSVRREIEDAPGEGMSSIATEHLKTCVECATFREKQFKLQEIVSSLGTVEAPGDFDFRLRARLANEKRRGVQPFALGNLSFGFRAGAVAVMMLLIGSALVFVSFRSPTSGSLSVSQGQPAPSTTAKGAAKQNDGVESRTTKVAAVPAAERPGTLDTRLSSPELPDQRRVSKRGQLGGAEFASARDNGRLKTRDLSTTPASVLKRTDPAAVALGPSVFPIGTSYQSLKVSLDDGRGSLRTISLPSVSFGSQRALAQGASPLFGSARDSW